MNQLFLDDMKLLLGDEYAAFQKTLDRPLLKAVRLNTLKTSASILAEIGVNEENVTPFNADTFYLDDSSSLGRSVYHQAGLFYLQEPSTTAVVTALDVKPGQTVLDLCAAPGGKSTQILSALKNTGLLWSNEISTSRCQALLSNLERWGADNFVLSNETPAHLAEKLAAAFDRIVVDAPCSGAAMFKKYSVIDQQYSHSFISSCALRQAAILEQAWTMLKPNGTMVYSTCTYNKCENEEVIASFLQTHPAARLVSTGLDCGRPGFSTAGLAAEKVRRIFPMDGGEGHFIAKIVNTQPVRCIAEGDQICVKTSPFVKTDLHIIRQGILAGRLVKGRLEPQHHLFVSLLGGSYDNFCNTDDQQIIRRFVRGEVLDISGYKGYVQIRYHNIPVGFGKGDGTRIKNHYPKGLRY